MSGAEDQGLAAAVGAAVVAIGAAIADRFRAKRRRRATPADEIELPAIGASTAAARIGAIAQKQLHLEQEITMLKQTVATKLDKLEESVDELCIARARTDELLPVIRDQLKELREELSYQRRATTHKD
jgi:hypothetical protein